MAHSKACHSVSCSARGYMKQKGSSIPWGFGDLLVLWYVHPVYCWHYTEYVGTHMSQQTILKERGLKTTIRKLRFIITVTLPLSLDDLMCWRGFLWIFSEEWLLLLHKNLKSFLFPCLQGFGFAVPGHRMLPFYKGETHILSTAKQPQKAQRIIYSDSSRSLFYSEIASDICSTMC